MAGSRRCSTAMLSAYTILVLALLAGSAAQDCPCPAISAPVCGTDSVTYGNECAASCAGVKIAHQGNCPDPSGCAAVSCTAQYAPVCGANNVTYSNDCNAACTGVTIAYKGECGAPEDRPLPIDAGGADGTNTPAIANPTCPGVACTEEFSPVCGADGATYANKCFASECAEVDIQYTGRCADPAGCAAVSCIALYAPVCGNDNVTYSNECNAGCTGVTIAYKGECGAPEDLALPLDGGGADGTGTSAIANPTCPGVACYDLFSPVCGADGSTYANDCFASECAKVDIQYTGRCADPAGCAAVSCIAQYAPVCGNDNVTYSNECNAGCTGVTIAYKGECGTPDNTTEVPTDGGDGGGGPSCACPKILSPVCGNGKTYANKCLASCANATVNYTGNCANPDGCMLVRCTGDENPVCGYDGVEYRNECFAACTGVSYTLGACVEEHKPPCICTKQMDPVCGDNGQTYNNGCLASCDGIKVAYRGNCANPDGCMLVRCSGVEQPVCGADGTEYRNECLASCTGVSYSPGACKGSSGKGIDTPRSSNTTASNRKLNPPPRRARSPPRKSPPPVSRKVAASECVQCEGLPLKPVCGADGITYGTACLAACSKREVVDPNGPCTP
ncbi:Serine protease inhibitor dipetalogastin [Tetrabaena socialis]|uniref:Serine protease inhibitor dipetalogastin n=1 Tax=Tetrabaena socialis TaxID=47790 RepID=A0A2J8A2T2_9CHLO|nr:Serine protease inhibitor dipetalogastin [Tetrabaena socialis]|eukprot:PNH06825.1 Serine protease inhibitor dipetalogastin [Tetrabaena socialis]